MIHSLLLLQMVLCLNNLKGSERMEQLTQNQAKIARKLNLRRGDSVAAMSLCVCYASGSQGYEKNLKLAWKYLQYAARLCNPDALEVITDLYDGGNFSGLTVTPNLNERVKYLRMLCFADKIINFKELSDDKEKIERYYASQQEAYITLGRLYIMEDSLNELELGHAISLKLAEENHVTESLFAMEYYWYYKVGEHEYAKSLSYFERALNNDRTYWANEALRYYNTIAKYVNEEYLGPDDQIPLYKK